MKTALLLAALASLDSSWRRERADLGKFELLRSYGPATSSTLSPAGTLFAIYAGNTVVLHDARDGRQVRTLAGHGANIHDSGWSRDGSVLATSGYDGKVIVWDVGTGAALASISPHAGYA